MLKILFLIHRWFGIGLGLIMVLWCLSGFVMMYKPYPELTPAQQLATQTPLALENCCGIDPALPMDKDFDAFRVLMLNGAPVLHLLGADGSLATVDLVKGEAFNSISAHQAREVADEYARSAGLPGAALLGMIHNDQWTVYGAYNPHRPLHHFAANDEAGTQWYVSSRTGEIIQTTTADQRFWGYLGAVIHWLYPTMLRERVALWSQTVIWLTMAGLFLTLTGLFFGIRQYKTRRSGRKSPYRGLSLWHHYTGLFFGVLTLVWVVSGLFSMNPWGWLEGEGPGREKELLRGGTLTGAEIASLVEGLDGYVPPPGTLVLSGQKLGGDLQLLAVDGRENVARLDPRTRQPDPLSGTDLAHLAARLSGGAPLEAGMLGEEDMFYYNHHVKVTLPVYKVVAGDAQRTHYYLHPQSGELLSKVDGDRKWYRWLHYGLHRGDFTGLLRSRPVWDLFMWPLLLGVTLVCFTGMCMGFRRLARNLARRRKRGLAGAEELPATAFSPAGPPVAPGA